MKVNTAVIIKISTILDIFENDMSKCYDIFRHFDTNFALDIFDIFVVFRHVVTTLVETIRKSFRVTGITSSNKYEYNSTLQHVILHGKFPDAAVEDLPPDVSPDSGDSFLLQAKMSP